jgi:hypothetical protein
MSGENQETPQLDRNGSSTTHGMGRVAIVLLDLALAGVFMRVGASSRLGPS